MIKVNIKENESQIRRNMVEAVSTFLNKLIFRKQGKIIREIRAAVPRWVESQPEIMSLRSSSPDSLAFHFGIPPDQVEAAINSIVEGVVNSLSININRVNKRTLQGGLEINFMPATFRDILSLPEGHVIYDDGDLHWLNWLLTEGFKVIVVGYRFRFDKGKGRSEGGYMVKNGVWRVPPQYAGTLDDNFITRALTSRSSEREIQSIIQRNLE